MSIYEPSPRTQKSPQPRSPEKQSMWLRQQLRQARHDAIVAYAAEAAGTALDLDADLEAAGIEPFTESRRRKR